MTWQRANLFSSDEKKRAPKTQEENIEAGGCQTTQGNR